eukprot:254928-Chlamydomonas_euryale.AAC.1
MGGGLGGLAGRKAAGDGEAQAQGEVHACVWTMDQTPVSSILVRAGLVWKSGEGVHDRTYQI